MENITSKKRKKLQPIRLLVFAFLFSTVFCFIFFIGCFSNIDSFILKIFNNIDRADHRVSAYAPANNRDISLQGKKLYSTEKLNPDNSDGMHCNNFSIYSQPQAIIVNTSGIQEFLSLPATIKKFVEKYAGKDSVNIKPEENNQQGTSSENGNSDGNTGKDSTNPDANQGNQQADAAKSFELQLLNLINSARQSKNLAGLNFNGTLNNIALSRSKDMINRGYFSHTTPEGKNIFIILQENGVGYTLAGENIYYSNPPSNASAEAAFKTWMGSQMHRANILSPNYSQIGIGIADSNEKLVITLVFSN